VPALPEPFGRHAAFASTDPNKRRIVAYDLRNPFRFTQRPGADELWIGDVGWNTWEEINRVVTPGQHHRDQLTATVPTRSACSGRRTARST
jgi:hypothetical protein